MIEPPSRITRWFSFCVKVTENFHGNLIHIYIHCFHISTKQSTYSVKPKDVAYFSEVVVTTSKLFKLEKIDSLLTLVIPVMIPLSIYGLVLKAELNKLLAKDKLMTG